MFARAKIRYPHPGKITKKAGLARFAFHETIADSPNHRRYRNGIGAANFQCRNFLPQYSQVSQNERWVSHNHRVLTELEGTLSTLKDAETGQRGYLLTGEERYLEPYNSAIARVNAQVSRLQQLTADNNQQQQRIRDLKIAIDSKLAELEETINLRREQNLEAALGQVKSGRGKQIMGGIRQQIATMTAEETQLLQQRARESQASANLTILTFTVAAFIDFWLLLLVYYLVKRDGCAPACAYELCAIMPKSSKINF